MSGRLRQSQLTRRAMMRGMAGAAGFAGGLGVMGRSRTGFAQDATPGALPEGSPVALSPTPLWQAAWANGIVYGTSLATWQASDAEYLPLVDHEAAILFTEDDLLWWRLKPSPDAPLDFQFADQFFEIAERQGQLVFAAHLVWDEGFGEGWTDDDLWGLDEAAARTLLYDTLEAQVSRYMGRVAGWIVANEIIDAHTEDGFRTDFPWYQTIGPDYAAEAFTRAHAIDPDALLVLNEFGLETDDEFDAAADKRANTLKVIDNLLAAGAPVQALGLEAHLEGGDFAAKFDTDAYLTFLSEVADRGLKLLITELDVLDDGLPADASERDQQIADVYSLYLETALQEPSLSTVITFGLTDRYTWLQEDYPRDDEEPRRPLPFDEDLRAKPAYDALSGVLSSAASRTPIWTPPRAQ